MQTSIAPAISIDPAELPSMLATLYSYENRFGPFHPQTLYLMAQVGFGYSQAREFDRARPLLERVVRDSSRVLGRDHELRQSAMAKLRDVFLAQRDYERVTAVQRELLDCQRRRLGDNHPETCATRSDLAMILLENLEDPTKEDQCH